MSGADAPNLQQRRILLAVAVLSAVIGVVVGAASAWAVYQHYGAAQQANNQPVTAGGTTASVSDIAAGHAPSLVTISTQTFTVDSLLGNRGRLSTGFVASSDGLVVTSAHALAGATQLRVAGADGHVYQAVIVATDTVHGVAVLRLSGAQNLTPLAFAQRPPRGGDLVVLLGRDPTGEIVGVGTARTAGATAQVDVGAIAGAVIADIRTTAQDDGAAMVNGAGDVVGIAMVGTPADVVVGAPADAAQKLIAALANSAHPATGFGASSQVLDPGVAALAGLPNGALILSVEPSSPAQVGGLLAGDVVTVVNGTGVDSTHPFEPSVFALSSGGGANLSVFRHGATLTVTVTLPGR